jgi:ATP-binding cassette subfamily F protein 3
LAKLEPVAMIAEAPPIELKLPEPALLRPPLISLEQASVGYATGQPVLSGLDLRLDPDDRVALLGANGNGKTTFARLLGGRLPAMSGEVRRPGKLVTGFFAQHQIEEMRPGESAYDHLAALLPALPPEAIRTRLGGFGFGQDKAFVPVSSLSGGERARLNLALVTHDAPALLILDEPTNHLDMETRESLVEALAEYRGAVVLVSHDWHLVELVADRLWLVEGGTVTAFDGDLDAYRRRLDEREPAEDDGAPRSAERDSKRLARQAAAQQRLALEPLRREARRAEAAAARFAAEQQALDRALAAPNGSGNLGVAEALKRRADLARRIAEAEAQWLAAEEAIERAQGS